MYCTLDLPSRPEFQSPPGLSHFHYGIPVSLYLWLLLGGGRSNMYISPETLLLQTNHHTFQRIRPCLEKECTCSPWYSCYTLPPNKPFPRRSQSLARWHFNWAFRKKLRNLHVYTGILLPFPRKRIRCFFHGPRLAHFEVLQCPWNDQASCPHELEVEITPFPFKKKSLQSVFTFHPKRWRSSKKGETSSSGALDPSL